MSPNEKSTETRHDIVNVCATVTRFWQWGSALFIAASATLLWQETRTPSPHPKPFRPLALVSLGYTTLVIGHVILSSSLERVRTASWHVFALLSIPGDLAMLGVLVAKIAVLSVRYFECSVLSKADDLVGEQGRFATQGSHETVLSLADEVSDPSHCFFPKGAYSLCIVAILSYILSIIMTVLQLWRYRKSGGSFETYGPSRPGSPASTSPLPPRPWMTQVGWQANPGHDAISRDPKYANMPEGIVASMAVAGGGEQSLQNSNAANSFSPPSSSSLPPPPSPTFNPELYLITDGFTRPDAPPAYTSRPSSLYGEFSV